MSKTDETMEEGRKLELEPDEELKELWLEVEKRKAMMELKSFDMNEVKGKSRSSSILIGTIGGMIVSSGLAMFLKGNMPVLDSPYKTGIMRASIGLVSGTLGSMVGNEMTSTIDDYVDVVDMFRTEVKARKNDCKKPKEVEIV